MGLACALVVAGPARADDGVLIRGTDLPAGSGLAHLGCVAPFGAGSSAQPYVGQGPATPPLGARSLGFDLVGGDAAGPVRYTSSMASVTAASLSVFAPTGSTGVAWAGYQDPAAAGTSIVWLGRAPLSVAGGSWQSVDVTALTYTWAQYDATTGAQLAPGPSRTVPDFVAAAGDGAGFWAIAFGCDGAPFNVDASRFADAAGGSTYDFEGLATALTMSGNQATVLAGDSVRLRGSLSATGGASIDHATAILERRAAAGDWETVRVVEAGSGVDAFVAPGVRTTYRWRFVDRPLAEGSTSATFVVDVARTVTASVADRRVSGQVSPAGAGLVVTLRSLDGAAVGTATTDEQGRYSVPLGEVSAGTYVVTVPATETNLRGESAHLQVTGGPSSPASPTSTPTATPSPTPSESPSSAPPAKAPASADPTPSRTPDPDPTPDAPVVSVPPSSSESAPAPSSTPADPTPSPS